MNMNDVLSVLFVLVLIGFVLQMLSSFRARAIEGVERSSAPSPTKRALPPERAWARTLPLRPGLEATRGITALRSGKGRTPDEPPAPRRERPSRLPAAPLRRAIVLMEILGPPRAL